MVVVVVIIIIIRLIWYTERQKLQKLVNVCINDSEMRKFFWTTVYVRYMYIKS